MAGNHPLTHHDWLPIIYRRGTVIILVWDLEEGDCLEVMPTLPENSFDLIILDPPYNINKAEWDKIGTHEDYLQFIEEVMVNCERLLKDNGSLYLWHNQFPVLADFQWLIKEKTGFIFKNLITWCKIDKSFNNSGFAHQKMSIEMARNYKGEFTEYLLYYTFQDETGLGMIMDNHIKPLHPFAKYLREEFDRAGVTRKEIARLFPSKTGGLTGCVSNWLNGDNVITKEQYLKIKAYLNNEYLRKEYEYLRKEYEDLRKEYEDLRYTYNVLSVNEDYRANSNVWLYPPETGHHPTQKPIKLSENIIKHSSNPNDNILIPFAGSGSEMIASLNLNRNVTGIESNPEYCQLIRERLNEQNIQTRLTEPIPAK